MRMIGMRIGAMMMVMMPVTVVVVMMIGCTFHTEHNLKYFWQVFQIIHSN